MKALIAAALFVLVSANVARSQDPGWPRQIVKPGGTLVYYQPQVDDWQAYTDLTWRMAFSLAPAGAKQVVGVMEMQGHTDVDNDKKMVLISGLKINKTSFPSLDATTAAQMDGLARTFLPPSVSISLHRLVACIKKPGSVSGVPLQNDPPAIFVSEHPAILLGVDGEPTLAKIPKTTLEFVVNTAWPLFFDTSTSTYYLLIGQRWLAARSLDGPWSPTPKLPADMARVAADPQWPALNQVIPPPAVPTGVIPSVFYSSRPAELILFDGPPIYSNIPGTRLAYSTNTSNYVFRDTATNEEYYLTGGRWFRADSLQGPWRFATMDLPADFAQIPANNPASVVLASVPGTDEAKDAVLLAQIPTTMTVHPAAAAANVHVSYGGSPQFEPISGTSLAYATNTQDKVIKVDDAYYLCLQGVWFLSTTPLGPWTVASSVPQVIYSIPPSSPVYNVTYVTQTALSTGDVQSSYTAGYMGAFLVGAAAGAIVANGSGYYYPPYIYHPANGYPGYYPYPSTYGAYGRYGTAAHYNSATGAYGVSRTVAGPYGSATRGAAYNPYTGTAARGATASTPYGSRSVGQAYNPYTGTYAATKQGSSPTAQWGSSVVSKGNQTAYTQHYTTARGTTGSVQTSSGAKAAASRTAYGNTTAAKTSSGDMYAGHDGNVYKNTGSGWQSYNSGGWNSANTGTGANRPAQASSSQMQGLQQEAQDRQRGAQQAQRFQQSGGGGAASFGGGGGARRGGGGGGGGGRRRSR
jgi:hypothetical protein